MKKVCRKSGKVKYDTHERALLRGAYLLKNPSPSMAMIKAYNAYLCQHCNKYHLATAETVEARVKQ